MKKIVLLKILEASKHNRSNRNYLYSSILSETWYLLGAILGINKVFLPHESGSQYLKINLWNLAESNTVTGVWCNGSYD